MAMSLAIMYRRRLSVTCQLCQSPASSSGMPLLEHLVRAEVAGQVWVDHHRPYARGARLLGAHPLLSGHEGPGGRVLAT